MKLYVLVKAVTLNLIHKQPTSVTLLSVTLHSKSVSTCKPFANQSLKEKGTVVVNTGLVAHLHSQTFYNTLYLILFNIRVPPSEGYMAV
uniref:Putative ovule protein n=1 Tax=Solanum chacoense TaxID=4108 RepID=A0A0V0I3J0_SOLCH